MAAQIIKAGDFATRSDLENFVRGKTSLTPEPKSNFEIHGNVEELARLHLSSRSIFWGIKCVNTEEQATVASAEPLPSRGDLHDSGLNGNVKPPPNK